jgi:hypothetical protein
MAIEDWGEFETVNDAIDEPRRHTLGGFRPGQGFAPSESDNDDTLTAPLDFELDDAPAAPDGQSTLDAALGPWKA